MSYWDVLLGFSWMDTNTITLHYNKNKNDQDIYDDLYILLYHTHRWVAFENISSKYVNWLQNFVN